MVQIVTVNVSQQVGPTPNKLQQTGAFISQGATNTAPGTSSLLTQLADLTPLLTGAKTMSALAYATGIVTATTSAPHGYTIGDTLELVIAGAAPSGYNGTVLATITGTSAFTYPVPGALATATLFGAYTPEDVSELVQMATTFFGQGSNTAVYVLELGAGNPNDGVTFLTAWITANPGVYYSYLVPRTWDANSSFLAMLANFESDTAKTYFFVTTTLATWQNYTNLMKCVYANIESPQLGQYPANALTSITYLSGLVTASTTTAHGVLPGEYFTISGCTPTGYNGTFLALPGTTGTTILYNSPVSIGGESVLGTLVASYYSNAGVPSTEFSTAAAQWVTLSYAPSTINKVTPTAFSYVSGVTPFPVQGNSALLSTLKTAGINVIGQGSEGGITNTMLLWGTTMDGRDFTYWYSVDWVQVNIDLNLSNAVINGSNNPQNPLYYDQNGINRLQQVAQTTINNGITFGLVLSPATVTAVAFLVYTSANPGDYKIGKYAGLAVIYTPQRGFKSIVFNVVVSDIPGA